MSHPVSKMQWRNGPPAAEALVDREWLVTNGLGGYASGTVAGVVTRRYHGLLIAGLPAPLGRYMVLSHLGEEMRLPSGELVKLASLERSRSGLEVPSAQHLVEFRLEAGLPVWLFQIGDHVLEKRLVMPHMQNTVHVTYRLERGRGPLRLRLRPAVHFRSHDAHVDERIAAPYALTITGERHEVSAGADQPHLRFRMLGQRASFTTDAQTTQDVLYRTERGRGYNHLGDLWSPGHFRVNVSADAEATLVASTEPWETVCALNPKDAREAEVARRLRLVTAADPAARRDMGAELVLAADQFIIQPSSRVEDAARAHAAGDEVRTVIAGYHWFTDWGRDTMISLEGLTLATGRRAEAGYILRTFAHYIRDGLIPNLFPEGEKTGLYHTADATLWFFHAVQRYLDATNDQLTLEQLLPRLRDIIERHVKGTHFGIGVDPSDGLLRQGAEGYQLTWMDAKVDGWVVTPRRGKAVEINALWYNALRLCEQWTRAAHGDAQAALYADYAERARASFNRRFWNEQTGCLYDVVDGEQGDDPAVRPNQVFAIALPHPVLARERWQPVMDVVRAQLVTPVGLRSLAPGHPDYRAKYDGDLRSRDAAYHQGTVWAWLIGPFIDAWLKLHPEDRRGARRFLEGFRQHLSEACVGSVSEIFDAEPPFTPRGCVAQAWSVAEVLRAWVLTRVDEDTDDRR